MTLSQLNLNHLRIFQTVYQQKNMTAAARILYMTQSGVSQHMKNLEDSLKVVLFDRVGKKLVPTKKAQRLYEEFSVGLSSIEQGVLAISEQKICGQIKIGAPSEFAHNVLCPLIAELQKKYPGVQVLLSVGLAPKMSQELSTGTLDLCFMDDVACDYLFESKKIFKESIELCLTQKLYEQYFLESKSESIPANLPLLAYEPNEPILKKWYKHHFEKSFSGMNVVAHLTNSQNVARMISLGAGAGVLAGHHINHLRKTGAKLKVIKKKRNALYNPISIMRLKNRSLTLLEKTVAEFLVEKLKDY